MATATETKKRGPGRPRKSESEFERGEKPDTVEREDEAEEGEEQEEGAYDKQGVLIDVDDPDQKKILTIARRIRARGKERSALQDADDKDREKLIELFHEKGITTFNRSGFEITIRELAEKVSVKSTRPADDDE